IDEIHWNHQEDDDEDVQRIRLMWMVPESCVTS
ncbi:hypothetical protein Tco_0649339, partial [Tanacetum coccineum]